MGFARADIHTSAPLTNLTLKVFNEPGDFVAEKIAPHVKVNKPTGKIYVYSQSNMRIDDTVKAPGSASKEVSRELSSITYTTHRYGLRMLTLDEDVAEADTSIRAMQQDDAEEIAEKLRLDYEQDVYTKVSTSGNYATNHTTSLTDEWDDYVNGDPIGDVKTAKTQVRGAIGRYPNYMAMSATDFESLKNHPDIIERYVYTGGMAAELTTKMVAKVLGLKDIFVSGATKNTANEGATDSLSDIWGEVAVVFFSSGSFSKKSVHFMRTLVSSKLRTRSYRADESIEGTWTDTDIKRGLEFLTVNDTTNKKAVAGYLIENIRT